MDFVAGSPSREPDKPIKNNEFWPYVDVEDLRMAMQISESITPPRLRLVTLDQIAEVNADLYDFRLSQLAKGYQHLNEVPASKLDETSILLLFYKKAVYSLVKSHILEKYRSLDLTNSGNKKAQDMEETIDELVRDARHAISDIQGRPHLTVDLL